MELIIHGTKGGYKILYSTPNIPQAVARDVRPDTSSEKAIGQSAYSLSFIAEGSIFTKYTIVRDMLRGMYTGNIAFSLLLRNNEKLSGAKIKSLLDEIAGWYSKYIPGNNLGNVYEDWSFIDGILSKYKSFCTIVHDNTVPPQSGTKDAAFIYCSPDEELHKYFDSAPFQEEYSEYKQVIFVNRNLKGSDKSPLNALRHSESDLTGKIDSENPFYRLYGFDGTGYDGVSIEIKNGKNQSLSNSDKIFRKETVSITCSKRYFKQIRETGRMNDENIKKYLIIDENSKQIGVRKDVILEPETKTVLLFVQDSAGERISNAEITCRGNHYLTKAVINSEVAFTGNEIGQTWHISAKNESENMLSETFSIVPEQSDYVRITVNKYKTVQIYVQNNIQFFKFRINGGTWEDYVSGVTFANYQISQTHNIEVLTKSGYYGKIENYHPATGGDIRLTLRPKESTFSKIIKPVKSHPKWTVSVITVLIFVAVGIWFWNDSLQREKKKEDYIKDIKKYVEDIKLDTAQLNDYSKQLQLVRKKEKDSAKRKKLDEMKTKINQANGLRTLIREANFAELKKHNYTEKQKVFKQSVDKIDSVFYEEVGDSLKKINLYKMDLKEIADKIDSIVTGIKEKNSTSEGTKKDQKTENKKADKPKESSPKLDEKQNAPGNSSINSNANSEIENITKELRGDNISQTKLKDYKSKFKNNNELTKSIDLYVDFWTLVNDKSLKKVDYDDLLEKVKGNTILKNGELLNFLNMICKNTQAFDNSFKSKISKIQKGKITTLKNLNEELSKK
jgi:hypothetical protein